MRILIIRHGDPDYAHDSLTERGFREAELLGERLEKEKLTAVYCSPLGRARATAAPTCRRIGREPVILDWLKEFPAPPVVTPGQSHPVAAWNCEPSYWSAYPEHFDREKWRDSPVFRDTGIGAIYDGICRQFDALIAEHGFVRDGMRYHIRPGYEDSRDTIALFCHLGLGGSLLSHITGVPLPQWWHTVFLPTSSVTTVFMEKHLPEEPVAIGRVIGVGDVSHLYGGGTEVSSSGLHNSIF